jgi:glycosyltransferase involved in cell wall biosynthesis
MPAPEAMRLGIPLVVSKDPALLEVTGGHAAVAEAGDAASLAAAVRRALASSPEELEAARLFAQQFTWRRTARDVRGALQAAIGLRSAGGSSTSPVR